MGKIIFNLTKIVAVFFVMAFALLLVNITLLLNALTLLISRRLFYHCGSCIPNLWGCLLVFCLQKYLNFRFTCHAPDVSQVERAMVIANHQTMLDVPALYHFANKFGKGQHPRWLGKKSFKHMPLLGWGGWLSGTMMLLHRDWARDREGLQETFRALVATPRPFWLCFFPEGTRLTPAKLTASQQHARAKNYPVLHKVLLPRPKGFTAAVHGLREHIDALLDVSVYYSQRPPFIASLVRGKRIDVVVQVKIIAPAALPNDDADLKQYLLDVYRAKDEQLLALEKNT